MGAPVHNIGKIHAFGVFQQPPGNGCPDSRRILTPKQAVEYIPEDFATRKRVFRQSRWAVASKQQIFGKVAIKKMKVFFLNPADKSSQTRVLTEIISVINESSETLRIAIAYFTHPEIAKALIQRIQSGRGTKLIINASDILRPAQPNETEIVISKNLLEVLRQNIVPRTLGNRSVSEYQNMHHKFMVSENKVIFGSLNWTTAALNNNFECVAVSSEPEAINLFKKEFERIWANAEELYVVSGKVRMIMCPICKSMDGVDFESWGPFCLFCGHKFKVV